jgi:hypothetical protein
MLVVTAGLAAAASTAGAAPAQSPQRGAEPLQYFGYNEDWSNLDKVPLAASGGANVLRSVISWRAIQPKRGKQSWEPYDLLYQRMVESGIRPMWVLADAPCWAWAKKAKQCKSRKNREAIARPPLPKHDDEWGDFAAEVAERYPTTAAIQSWNEPNLVDFWKPRPNAERAAEITVVADKAVRKVNPEIQILFGGLAPLYETIPEKREIAYDEFLRDAYKAVGRGHWDAVAMHPFPRFRNHGGYLADIEEHLDAVRAALRKSRASGTPLWVTEIGLSTAGSFPYTEEEQERGLLEIYEQLVSMPDVDAMIVHRLVDLPPDNRAESGWGVIRDNGEPKPAYCTLARLRGVVECPPPPPPDPEPSGGPEPYTGAGSR